MMVVGCELEVGAVVVVSTVVVVSGVVVVDAAVVVVGVAVVGSVNISENKRSIDHEKHKRNLKRSKKQGLYSPGPTVTMTHRSSD